MNKHSRFSPNGFKLVVMALAIGGAGSAMAANNATATSTSTVIAPISITKSADLSFGSFAAGASLGTVTLSPNGTRAVTGGAVAAGGTVTAAKFDVTGDVSKGYTITLGGTSVLTSGTDTMGFTTISDLSASAITTGNVTAGTLTGGPQSIYVGGVLNVAINQPAGTYTGTVIATVNYN
jgi:spore coat protein U-like protein